MTRSRRSIVLSVPGWVYLAGCVIGFFPMVYAGITDAAAGRWFGVGAALALWLMWPALFFIHGPWSELPKAFILTIVGAIVLTGWVTFVLEWRHWLRRHRFREASK